MKIFKFCSGSCDICDCGFYFIFFISVLPFTKNRISKTNAFQIFKYTEIIWDLVKIQILKQ